MSLPNPSIYIFTKPRLPPYFVDDSGGCSGVEPTSASKMPYWYLPLGISTMKEGIMVQKSHH